MMMTNIRQLIEKLETLRKDEKYLIIKLNRVMHKLETTRKEIRVLDGKIDNVGEQSDG